MVELGYKAAVALGVTFFAVLGFMSYLAYVSRSTQTETEERPATASTITRSSSGVYSSITGTIAKNEPGYESGVPYLFSDAGIFRLVLMKDTACDGRGYVKPCAEIGFDEWVRNRAAKVDGILEGDVLTVIAVTINE